MKYDHATKLAAVRLGCCLIVGMFAIAEGPCTFGQAWPGFGGPGSNHRIDVGLVPETPRPMSAWNVELGEGRSAVLSDQQHLYVTHLKPWSTAEQNEPAASRDHIEVIRCLDRSSGKTKWSRQYDAGYLEEQQTFGGRHRAPQATPLLIKHPRGGQLLATIGFTGQLRVSRASTGDLLWEMDLPKRFDATPVAFGYSASPINVDGQLVVFAGGADGGLVAFDPADGRLL